jgi:NDP-sugar pyrophosphorylase family protein
MRALILAAGLGTRLGSLSDERPKPLLPVCDIPLIRYAIALVAGHGVREIAVNLHHRGELIERELGDGASEGVHIRYSHEPTILGTGGGIRRLQDFLTDGGRDSFLVVNGKILIDVDLHAVVARHQATGAAATMVLRETPDAARWGAIEVDDAGRVTRIIGQGTPGARVCMFTGVHVLAPPLVERLPPDGESDSIRQAYLPALADGEHIEGFLLDGYFHEHSTPARYLEGNWNALAGRARLRHPPGPLTGIDPTARLADPLKLSEPYRIGAGAVVGPHVILGPDVVIGAGARVEAGVRLERVVVWPGAVVTQSLNDAIVTPRGVHQGEPHG